MMKVKIACRSDDGILEIEQAMSSEGVPIAGRIRRGKKEAFYNNAWLAVLAHLEGCDRCRRLNNLGFDDVQRMRGSTFRALLQRIAYEIWDYAKSLEKELPLAIAVELKSNGSESEAFGSN